MGDLEFKPEEVGYYSINRVSERFEQSNSTWKSVPLDELMVHNITVIHREEQMVENFIFVFVFGFSV